MIKFTCSNCDHGIKVNEKYVGKKGKCPNCGGTVVVPSMTSGTESVSIIKFRCPNCRLKIGLKPEFAGKRVRCAHCRQALTVPAASETSKPSLPTHETDVLRAGSAIGATPDNSSGDFSHSLEDLLAFEDKAPAVSLPQKKEPDESYTIASSPDGRALDRPMAEEPEIDQEGKRKLPWPIDVFLYPFSRGGIGTIGIFVGGYIIAFIASMFCCLAVIVQLLLLCYMAWYFSECIRDSADGGIRAPDTIGRQESLLEMFWQLLRLFFCHVIYLSAGPILYSFLMLFSSSSPNDTVLLVMTIIGSFLYPMAIISVSVLSSIEGLNPILLIRSVASTFVQYIGLVILLNGVILIYYFLLASSFFAMMRRGSQEAAFVGPIFVGLILGGLGFFWLLLVLAHILGRFYWRYEHKLNW